ncbi:hypothetical protein BX600DRAFT_442187 [Xylariales sp. PMI_506]|nr:hypothetical protein BX600DRAFT_442187 [Xylariales sp. PMI_506]
MEGVDATFATPAKIRIFDLSLLLGEFLETPTIHTDASELPRTIYPPPFSHALAPKSGSAMKVSPVRNVADLPMVNSIIGTVKRFNSWFLVFISKQGWTCSVELCTGALDTFQKHFFTPSVWRTGNKSLISRVRRNQEVAFVHQDGIIVVKNGLDNGEHVSFF